MSTAQPAPDAAALGPYLRTYGLSFAFCSALVAVIVSSLSIENSAMGIICVIAAASGPAQQFALNNRRVMARPERARFSLYGTLISIVITALLFAVAMLIFVGWENIPAAIDQARAMAGNETYMLPLIDALTFLINFVILYFIIGIFGKLTLKQQAK